MSDVERLKRLLTSLAPCGAPFIIREPLQSDESLWFLAGLDSGLFKFGDCPQDCFRLRKWSRSGPDHFDTPAGKPRHLFSKPDPEIAQLNREYIPHLAAYSRAILDLGYDPNRSSLSFYRKFRRNLVTKRAGQSYETDAEFYDGAGRIYLQIEAKSRPGQTERLAAQVKEAGSLAELPPSVAKEIEYVLDLAPRYLWVVGPGSIDPESHVFAVEVDGLNAVFHELPRLPSPPSRGEELELT